MGILGGMERYCNMVRSMEDVKGILETKHDSTIVVASVGNPKLYDQLIYAVYDEIKEHNRHVKDPQEQILPANPYCFTDIDGCLAVRCAEIGHGTMLKDADGISLTGWYQSALVQKGEMPSINPKALTTLAMLGQMVSGGI